MKIKRVLLAGIFVCFIFIVLLLNRYFLSKTQLADVPPFYTDVEKTIARMFPKVLVAAGDIACDSFDTSQTACKQHETAALVKKINPEIVLALGDLQYPDGSYENFTKYYNASWGAFVEKTHPVPGNHEYETPGAKGYFDYFNAIEVYSGRAGERKEGYYSFNVGADNLRWHVVALNSNCWAVGGCNKGSEQLSWLEQDLKNDSARCTLAYWHHPYFSSGQHGSNANMSDVWRVLDQNGVDIVLSGHDHLYERFAPQNADGVAQKEGVRQFTVGTGGRNFYQFKAILQNSEVRNNTHFGVLKLTLGEGSYEWEFVPIEGSSFSDKGSERCH